MPTSQVTTSATTVSVPRPGPVRPGVEVEYESVGSVVSSGGAYVVEVHPPTPRDRAA